MSTLVASGAEDDFRGRLLKVFHLGHHPGEAPRRQEPSQTFFQVSGVDRNKQVQAVNLDKGFCATGATIKLAL